MSYARRGRIEAAAAFAAALRSTGWRRRFARGIVVFIGALVIVALLAQAATFFD